MATLTLSSWYISNNETTDIVASDADPKLRKLAFGDLYTGYFTYTTDVSIGFDTEIRFNPGLFVRQGFQDTPNLDTTTEVYFFRARNINSGFSTMSFVGDANSESTGRNNIYRIRKLTNFTFEISVEFYMTSDTANYFGAVTSGQYSRLTSDRFSQNSPLYTNGNNTIYTTNAALDNFTLGLYCSLVYNQPSRPGIRIFSATPLAANTPFTLERVSGMTFDFLVDGWDDPCGTMATNVQITVYTNGTASTPLTFQGTLDPSLTSASLLTFTSSVGFPSTLNGGGYVVDLTATECGVTYRYGTLGDPSARIKDWDWLDVDGLFANDGIHTDRVFNLLRSGNTVTTINTTIPTDIQFDFTYTGSDVTTAKMWIIPTNMGNDATEWWIDSLDRNALQFQDTPVPVNIVGNEWRITTTIDPGTYNLNDGDIYHFLFVLYDDTDNYYASYSYVKEGSFNVRVSSQLEIPTDGTYCPPVITGFMSTYKNEFPSSDNLRVSPLQRVAAGIRLDKIDYNSCSEFNRIQSIVATLSYTNGAVLAQSTISVSNGVALSTDPTMDVIDNPASVNATWRFRIEHEYTNRDLLVTWKVNSLTEPTETFFTQVFKVDDYQQNLPPLEQKLTEIVFYENDIDGFVLDESDRNCSGSNIAVETVRNVPISEDYYQAAVWLDDSLTVTETDGFLGGVSYLPQVVDTNLFDVEERFSAIGDNVRVNYKATSTVNNGEVGMIGYPPPLPNNVARVMWHHTNPNGRNIVFNLQDNLTPGTKFYFNLGGTAISADYTFRIGDTVTGALNDANNVAWAAYPSISFVAFVGATIPAGSYIRVEYNGSTTANTDIVACLDYFVAAPASYPKVLAKTFPSSRIAANDIMLYPKIETNFTGIATGAALRFTEKRTSVEVGANTNLTDFVAGETAWQPPNDTTGNHLFLQQTVLGSIDNVSIVVNSAVADIQLSTYATPLQNQYYPVTGDGSNIQCYESDLINDRCQYIDTDGFVFDNTLDFGDWADGQTCTFFTNHFSVTGVTQSFFGAASVGSGGFRVTMYGAGCILYGVAFGGASTPLPGYWRNVFVVTKVSGLNMRVKQYINGALRYDQTAPYDAATFASIKATYLSNRIINLDNPSNPSGQMMKRQSEIICLFREATPEEVRRYALGEISFTPDLHWDFTSNTGATIPELVTGRNATLFNSTNLRTNYFV